jgi:hypothetical protein
LTFNSAGTFSYSVSACNASGCGQTSAAALVQVAHQVPSCSVSVSKSSLKKREAFSLVSSCTNSPTSLSWYSASQPSQPIGSGSSIQFSQSATGDYGYFATACNSAGCSNSNTVQTEVGRCRATSVPQLTACMAGLRNAARDGQSMPCPGGAYAARGNQGTAHSAPPRAPSMRS